jgi:hypothetical protein
VLHKPKAPNIAAASTIGALYLCNAYIAPALFSEIDQMSQAIISTAISVSIAAITPIVTNAIEIS